ncbi:multidrug efflux SMR transporter [Micromonospora sp. WMMD1082]|uniref:DMT family transporter n=1 Tax=Micromonospora sp. WMMD1082 TaxID=3016104 RepID=UPI002417E3E4|nr:multidrug efflux SMR transporter [Micromonospora sp. WMMD1082]MDG4795752.1 multidrug efflux SMR transporter [Micromonospora sp. WMMD1082]
MAWVFLVVAGLLEIAWSSALKKADGLRRTGWSIAGIALAILSLALLSLALGDLPVGTAYAVWVGIGAVGVALTGIVAFGDRATPTRLAGLAAIVTGIVGLKLLGG